MASVYTSLHRYQEALNAVQKAEIDFAAVGDLADEGMVQFQRGRALAGLGQQRKALESFARAEREFDAAGNQRYQEMLLLALTRQFAEVERHGVGCFDPLDGSGGAEWNANRARPIAPRADRQVAKGHRRPCRIFAVDARQFIH